MPKTQSSPISPAFADKQYNPSAITHQVRRNRWLLAAIVALPPLAIDTYLPAVPDIAKTFGVAISQAEFSISVFLVFFALGQLVGGPVADRKGRRVVTLFGVAAFAAASASIVVVPNAYLFVLFRALQAFAGGLAVVACFAATRDAFSGSELGMFVSTIIVCMLIAPLVAPFIGSGILLALHWRWIFVCISVYALALIGWSWWKFGETRNPAYQPGSVYKSYMAVLQHRQSFLLLLAPSLSMTVMFSFLTRSTFIYQVYFGVSPQQYAFLFMLNVVSIILITRSNVYLLKRFSMRQLMGAGIGAQLAACLALVALAQTDSPSLVTFVPLMSIAIGCMGLVLPNAASALMTLHPADSGTCNALGGMGRFAFGGTFGAIPLFFSDQGFAVVAISMLLLAFAAGICWLLLKPETRPGIPA